jgi:hypothetical protein
MNQMTKIQLMDLASYDPETGNFTWKQRPRNLFKSAQAHSSWNTRYAGKNAGNVRTDGYVSIRIFTQSYLAHRLAWLYMTGNWPAEMIDHEDGVRNNNKWGNLRTATPSQNGYNTGPHINNKSGFKGVYRYRDSVRWQASIRTDKGRKWLGIYDTPEEAHAAYAKATKLHHGEFGRAL